MMKKTLRIRAVKSKALLLFLVLFMLPVYLPAAEQKPEKTSVDTDQKASDAIPDLSEIVPQQVKLTTRLDSLKKQLQDGSVHTPSLESGYAEIGADLDVIALSALGIEVSKITIMLSALGVGIGFGLQGIVNNFVSGLVLLFEQPVRVGDLIETNGMWSEIKHIGIQATRVRNFDHADMIIPNADLVANQVTNWTLGDRQARLRIAVGVAYGSEVNLVMETLIACAQDNTSVTQSPVPQALFLNFGESSLDFELRVFVKASMRVQIQSELHQEIDKRFRENNINIAFPQRELHVPRLDVQLNNKENQQGGPSNETIL